jgi:hypothetical protein
LERQLSLSFAGFSHQLSGVRAVGLLCAPAAIAIAVNLESTGANLAALAILTLRHHPLAW